jgi:uncharacterized flavoprotein (TIGR03862 family)
MHGNHTHTYRPTPLPAHDSAAHAVTAPSDTPPHVAVIGAGPAGLMAAEVLAGRGYGVTIYERMPSPARKFLMAGRGGLNLTHSEPLDHFLNRYGEGARYIRAAIAAFPPDAVIAWAQGLGQETFTGSSGRVFPRVMKASPLLRAWLKRLDSFGVTLETRHTFEGFSARGGILICDADGNITTRSPGATILALGGASWPKLGGDGAWVAPLTHAGVDIAPLIASNAGVLIAWTDFVKTKFAGEPLKRIALTVGGVTVRGEAIITDAGLEGGAVYALSRPIRDALAQSPNSAPATLTLDLRPDMTAAALAERLERGALRDSLSNHLRKAAGLSPAQIALLYEGGTKPDRAAETLARSIKNVVLPLAGLQGLERAISTTGGVRLTEIDAKGMLTKVPGVFLAGEMLDWDAPTGGYLLQASFATGVAAALGAADWISLKSLRRV